jgi:23S rRNA (adenine2030-N6)-methyltransferase
MNYRHAYHAGNFADCFKHALLIALLDAFARKPTPFFVLDTHAGAGQYDLDGEEARRTAESDTGIRRLLSHPPPALARYLDLVTQHRLHPGSPALIRSLLRQSDRLACCELHPSDCASLRRMFRDEPRVEVHERSGWEALGALLPPKEKRGLVLIDPPFEAADDFFTLASRLRHGHARFRHGVFAAWYPIKQMAMVRGLHADLQSSGIPDIIAVELRLQETADLDRLNGCGLIVINPPYQFADQARAITSALLTGFGVEKNGASASLVRITDE